MKKSFYYIPGIFLFILILFSCRPTDRSASLKQELIDIDLEFSKSSGIKGSHSAFLEYIDDSCVLLRPNKYPVIGREKIAEMFNSPDTSFSLVWDPLGADIAASGDLGYTYGIYRVEMDSPDGSSVTKEGTYVTIWKKDENGNWKFVLDTGNQGLGKKNGKGN